MDLKATGQFKDRRGPIRRELTRSVVEQDRKITLFDVLGRALREEAEGRIRRSRFDGTMDWRGDSEQDDCKKQKKTRVRSGSAMKFSIGYWALGLRRT